MPTHTYDRPNAPLSQIQNLGINQQQFLTGIFTTSQFPKPT